LSPNPSSLSAYEQLAFSTIHIECETDAGITTAVKSKMAVDDTVKAYQVNVETQNHVVTLSGDMNSSLAKERAIVIARETDGVRDVIDRLVVTDTTPTSGLTDRTADSAHDLGVAVKHDANDAADHAADAADDVAASAKRGGNAIADGSKEVGVATKDAAVKVGKATARGAKKVGTSLPLAREHMSARVKESRCERMW